MTTAREFIERHYETIRDARRKRQSWAEILSHLPDAGKAVQTLKQEYSNVARMRGDTRQAVEGEAKAPPPTARAALAALRDIEAREAKRDVFGEYMREQEFAAYVSDMVRTYGVRKARERLTTIGLSVPEKRLRDLAGSPNTGAKGADLVATADAVATGPNTRSEPHIETTTSQPAERGQRRAIRGLTDD